MPGERGPSGSAVLSSELVDGMGAASRERHRAACEALLSRLLEAPELYAGVVELMRKGSPLERFGAAWVLFRARRPGLALLPALLHSLALDDGDRRWEAAHMLATLGRMEPQVQAVLQGEARSASAPSQRRMALFVLRELAPEAPETREVFLASLDDGDPTVRRAALSSLAKLVPVTDDVLQRCLDILASGADARMRLLATAVVAALACERTERIEEVRRALEAARGRDPTLAHACGLALRRLDRQDDDAT